MSQTTTTPREREIESTCHSIRARWSNTKRRQRRQLAKAKQRQLMRWLTAGNAYQHAL